MKVKNALPPRLGLAALLVLLAAPGWSATYHVYGGVYAADPIPENTTPPPSVLPSALTPDEIVGEEEYFAVGLLSMVRVDVLDDSSGSVLASTVGLLGPYYTSFDVTPSAITVRFSLHDAATGDQLFETAAVNVSAGTNRRYLLAPISVLEVGGASLIPHPPGVGPAYLFTRVGLVENADIGSDGLADFASAAVHWRNAPFGRSLRIFGAATTALYTGGYCYKVKADPPGPTPAYFIDEPLAKRRYVVDTSTLPPTVSSNQVTVGPKNYSGVSGCYDFTPMSAFTPTGETIFWSFPDQLARWETNSRGHSGNHRLTLHIYQRATGTELTNPNPLHASHTPINIHVNNTGVDLSFDEVAQLTPGGTVQTDLLETANRCDKIELTGGHQLRVGFTAHHADGFLATYSLYARSNVPVVTTMESGAYTGTGSFGGTSSSGQTLTLTEADLPGSCAYAIRLHAWARTTNGYGRLFHPEALLTYYINDPTP